MIKVDKLYTIKFSKSGISQRADFNEVNGKIYNPSLSVQYCKSDEVPSLENLDNIEDILAVIKEFSYGNQAEITLINSMPINYYKNIKAREYNKSFNLKFDQFIEIEAIKYFETILEPIMKRNKFFISTSHIGMPVLIKKYNGEWDNIKGDKDSDFNYLCKQFTSKFKSNDKSYDFQNFFNCIPTEYFEDNGLYLENL